MLHSALDRPGSPAGARAGPNARGTDRGVARVSPDARVQPRKLCDHPSRAQHMRGQLEKTAAENAALHERIADLQHAEPERQYGGETTASSYHGPATPVLCACCFVPLHPACCGEQMASEERNRGRCSDPWLQGRYNGAVADPLPPLSGSRVVERCSTARRR